jgi:hypothetical protein
MEAGTCRGRGHYEARLLAKVLGLWMRLHSLNMQVQAENLLIAQDFQRFHLYLIGTKCWRFWTQNRRLSKYNHLLSITLCRLLSGARMIQRFIENQRRAHSRYQYDLYALYDKAIQYQTIVLKKRTLKFIHNLIARVGRKRTAWKILTRQYHQCHVEVLTNLKSLLYRKQQISTTISRADEFHKQYKVAKATGKLSR